MDEIKRIAGLYEGHDNFIYLGRGFNFPVALVYDGSRSAPEVVAKGADLIALKIKEIAIAHAVPIVEDRPLAQTLFRSVDVGEEIPEKLFQAVAQLLAYIYRLKHHKQSSYEMT